MLLKLALSAIAFMCVIIVFQHIQIRTLKSISAGLESEPIQEESEKKTYQANFFHDHPEIVAKHRNHPLSYVDDLKTMQFGKFSIEVKFFALVTMIEYLENGKVKFLIEDETNRVWTEPFQFNPPIPVDKIQSHQNKLVIIKALVNREGLKVRRLSTTRYSVS